MQHTSLSRQPDLLNVIVDLGATHLRIGLANDFQPPSIVRLTPTTKEEILETLCDSITKLATQYSQHIGTITVGCPGLVNDTGLVLKSLHLPLSGCNLKAYLGHRFKVTRIQVINDAKAQALSFIDKYVSTFYIVVGTGVGGAIIDRGTLVIGAEGFAGEIGHIRVGTTEVECVCGEKGCVDAYASGWSLAQKLGADWYTRPLTPNVIEALSSAGYYIGRAATLGMVLLNPQAIIIAGHITAQAAFKSGFSEGWRRSEWTKVHLEFFEHTWPLASRGLSFLATRGENT
jgi:predicted NBD/HSP70 family sugar kinase